ncbi:aminomethyl transferase family protein [Ligilactobacillus acidipiscis]|uniref:aminomethyl transferase family protein n=1 Tax=Ligilactobacillus acidipiscis TaxID=89059 RepID=UPI0023F84499|nr:aminomethyl transferase family protein [Ligilactobacillus acidipiscis]WEV56211.1 aminomethyl transferase family protein [Ligilactobacillus acidipiscis]
MLDNSKMVNSILNGVSLTLGNPSFGSLAFEYTGVNDEARSMEESAYVGTTLMYTATVYDISGPDVVAFFNRFCVNKFDKLQVGAIRHAILCNEKGQIMTDGVVMRISNDTFRAYCLAPCLSFLFEKYGKDYNITGKDQTGQDTLFQVAGPEAYNIISEVLKNQVDKLDNLKFAHHDIFEISGKAVRILRLGMTGNLAYEIHSNIADGDIVYNAIWESAKKHGAKKIGMQVYTMSHTPGGMPNINMHYPMPWYESEEGTYLGFSDYLDKNNAGYLQKNRRLVGSVGENLQTRFVTPFDTGWGNLVKFTHDFPGKEALKKLKDDPKSQRHVVTLEWNADDIADVYKSQFEGRDVIPFDSIDERPVDMYYITGDSDKVTYHADKVYAGDHEIGISSMRTVSPYYQHMISLGFIDGDYTDFGTELVVLWGNEGHPQKKIRAKVSYYPYVSQDQEDNRTAKVGSNK